MPIELEVEYGDLPASPDLVISRYAVRAVVVRASQLLLLRSRHGDLKFPGGGVESGETPYEALTREIAEECGVAGARIGEQLVRTVERRRPQSRARCSP
jgi:8-oxo-dGTP pyrophosphatase MutT (NUDIX family)